MIIFLAFNNKSTYSQVNRDTVYIDLLTNLLDNNVFKMNNYLVCFQDDTCFFYCRSENYINDTEKSFEFDYNDIPVKVLPGDHIFYYDLNTYIRIINFQLKNPLAQILIEKHKDGEIIGRLSVNLKWKNGEWKIKKVKKIAFEKSHINK